MKKKLSAGILILSAALPLCGFDSAPSAQNILEQSSEAASSASSLRTDLGLNADIALAIGDGTITTSISFLADADYTISLTLDPFAAKVEGSYLLSSLGFDETEETQLYAVINEDGTLAVYEYTEDASSQEEGSWNYSEDSSFNYNDLLSSDLLSSSMPFDIGALADWGLDFTLAPEPEDYNGTQCYHLSAAVDVNSLETTLEQNGALTGEDSSDSSDLSDALSVLDGLRLQIDYYADTASYLPAALHMDLNSSDLSGLNASLLALLSPFDSEDADTSIAIVLNNLSFDCTMSYNDVDSITVPQEALDAAKENETETESPNTFVIDLSGGTN